MHLLFGKALNGIFDGWNWAEKHGMKVDEPWAFDRGAIVHKNQLIQLINDGRLKAIYAIDIPWTSWTNIRPMRFQTMVR